MRKLLALLIYSLVVVALLTASAPVALAGVDPNVLRSLFEANAVAIMFVWGLVHKYVPALEKLENALIPWANFLGYVIAKLFPAWLSPDAHASAAGAVGAIPDALGVILAGATNSAVAAVLFDKFAKPWLDRLLRRRAGLATGSSPSR